MRKVGELRLWKEVAEGEGELPFKSLALPIAIYFLVHCVEVVMENLSQHQLQQAAHAFLAGNWSRPAVSYVEQGMMQQCRAYSHPTGGVSGAPPTSVHATSSSTFSMPAPPAPQRPPLPMVPWMNNAHTTQHPSTVAIPCTGYIPAAGGSSMISVSPSHADIDSELARHMKEGHFVHQLSCAGASKRAVQNKAASIYKKTVLEGDDSKLIATDESGNVIGNKLQLNSMIVKYAGCIMDLGKVYFRQHEENDDVRKVERKVHSELHFAPFPLKKNYIRDYLQTTIKDARYKWQQYYKVHKAKHPKCKVQWYAKLQPYWESEEFKQSSQEMTSVYKCRSQDVGSAYFHDDSDSAVPYLLEAVQGGLAKAGASTECTDNARQPDVVVGSEKCTNVKPSRSKVNILGEEGHPSAASGTMLSSEEAIAPSELASEKYTASTVDTKEVNKKLAQLETTLFEHKSTLVYQNSVLMQQSVVQTEILELLRGMKGCDSELSMGPQSDDNVHRNRNMGAQKDDQKTSPEFQSAMSRLLQTRSSMPQTEFGNTHSSGHDSDEITEDVIMQSKYEATELGKRKVDVVAHSPSEGEPKQSLPGFVLPMYGVGVNCGDTINNEGAAPATTSTTASLPMEQAGARPTVGAGEVLPQAFVSTVLYDLSTAGDVNRDDPDHEDVAINGSSEEERLGALPLGEHRRAIAEPSTAAWCPSNPRKRGGQGGARGRGGRTRGSVRGRGRGKASKPPMIASAARAVWRSPASTIASDPGVNAGTNDNVAVCDATGKSSEQDPSGSGRSRAPALNPHNSPPVVASKPVGSTKPDEASSSKTRQANNESTSFAAVIGIPQGQRAVPSSSIHILGNCAEGSMPKTNAAANLADVGTRTTASQQTKSSIADPEGRRGRQKKRGRPQILDTASNSSKDFISGSSGGGGVIVEVPDLPEKKSPRQRRRRRLPAKLLNRVAPKEVKPRLSQTPLPSGTEVWILHPADGGRVVASGIAGPHYQNRRPAANGMPQRVCEHGQQTVEVVQVVEAGTNAMYAEMNGTVRTVDEASQAEYSHTAKLVWDTHLLIPIWE